MTDLIIGFTPITASGFAALFNWIKMGGSGVGLPRAIHFSRLGPEYFRLWLVLLGSTDDSILFQVFSLTSQGPPAVTRRVVYIPVFA